jgi:GNAT superfamily N-acetyltransferase
MTLRVRPTQPSDRDAVFAFCAHIWEGHDYVPSVWDEWLNDSQGIFLTALQDGVPVAVARAYFPAPDEAWLEGMRVDPEHRSAGIATALFEVQVEESRRRGARVARLMTVGDNFPVHRMCAKLGFDLVLRLRRRMRPFEVGPAPAALRQLGGADLSLVQELLSRPARVPTFLQVTQGLYSLVGGIWIAWNEERLREHLARGEVWTWAGNRGPRAVAVVCPHRRRPGVSEVGLLEGPAADCTALLAALVRQEVLPVGEPDSEPGVRMHLPVELSRLHRAAAQAGYRTGRRGKLFIFEKKLG